MVEESWSDSSARAVLQLMVESVAEMVGFEVAVLSVVVDEQLMTVAYAGPEEFRDYLRQRLPMLSLAPVTCLSAQEDFRLDETLALAEELHAQAGQRMSTGEVNRLVKGAMQRKGPPVRGGRTGKIFFAAQIDVHPPTIVIFVNDPDLLSADYQRYLARYLREHGPYPEVPLRFLLRARDRE